MLHVTHDASLLIEEEPQIVHLLLEADDGNGVRVVLVPEFTVLHNLLIVEVSVLGLDRLQLVAKRQEILIALLDLENFSLELRDQKVLLV